MVVLIFSLAIAACSLLVAGCAAVPNLEWSHFRKGDWMVHHGSFPDGLSAYYGIYSLDPSFQVAASCTPTADDPSATFKIQIGPVESAPWTPVTDRERVRQAMDIFWRSDVSESQFAALSIVATCFENRLDWFTTAGTSPASSPDFRLFDDNSLQQIRAKLDDEIEKETARLESSIDEIVGRWRTREEPRSIVEGASR